MSETGKPYTTDDYAAQFNPPIPNTETDETGRNLGDLVGVDEVASNDAAQVETDDPVETHKVLTPDELTMLRERTYSATNYKTFEEEERSLLPEGDNPNDPNDWGSTPLMIAASRGYLDAVAALLKVTTNVNREGQDGYTALEFASQSGHLSVVEALLIVGADPTHIGTYTKDSALSLACQNGHPQVVNTLCHYIKVKLEDEGAREFINQPVSHSQEPLLIVAASGGYLYEIKDIESTPTRTPPEFARKLQNPEGLDQTVEILLNHYKTLGITNQDELNTALAISAARGKISSAKHLIEHGASINYASYGGGSALAWAAKGGYRDVIHLLLSNGANFTADNYQYNRAFILACEKEQAESIESLLNHIGIDIQGALLTAVQSGRASIIPGLLRVADNNVTVFFDENGELIPELLPTTNTRQIAEVSRILNEAYVIYNQRPLVLK